jgi:FtsP/CotA-like multicopper oxidase with cupredoxin domain
VAPSQSDIELRWSPTAGYYPARREIFTIECVRTLTFSVLICAEALAACAQVVPGKTAAPQISEACTREAEGSVAVEPRDLTSENGALKVALRMLDSIGSDGHARYCYLDERGNQAPTLRVQPGDRLVLSLRNEISVAPAGSSSQGTSKSRSGSMKHSSAHDPCGGGTMTPSSTNLHFHGLSIPPVCHQDETIKTLIQPDDPPFEYRVEIPKNQPPGLYWYHPHVHGFSEQQILGGASGALIVEGMERAVPRVAGLRERVFVIRDEEMPNASEAEKADPNRPTKQLSINYVRVPYPKYPTAVIRMKPLERQFWRVLNASADTYLDLSVEFGGKRQTLDLVALDGVPLHYGEPGASEYAPQRSDVFLPPGGRAEFIITGPPAGVSGLLRTSRVYRGAADDNGPIVRKDNSQPALRLGLDDVDPPRPLATLMASTDGSTNGYVAPASARAPEGMSPPLSSVRPVRKRKLYFSEQLLHPEDPQSSTLFFITEEGHSPAVFDPGAEPNITVHQGEVEDWTIENRSRESHAFHIHQLHFLIVGMQGVGWEEVTLRDTVNLPAWDGFGRYPSITLRMDFRDPRIVGTFPFHCHILQHVDGGMMGTVRIEPDQKAAREQ